jgi:hypothetical protein
MTRRRHRYPEREKHSQPPAGTPENRRNWWHPIAGHLAMIRADLSLPHPIPGTSTALTAAGTTGLLTVKRTALQKCGDVLKVLLRTFNDIRRLLRDSAAEIGEIVGGDLGREVGRIGASFLLGLMSETLLGDAGSQAATDQFGQVT